MEKLLVVDDSQDLLDALEYLLCYYGYEVRTATNHRALLKELESFKPSIVIIDVKLNGENGRDICKSFRKSADNKHITLILFSASAGHLDNFEECGADGVIEKPFVITELHNKIEAAVRSRKEQIA